MFQETKPAKLIYVITDLRLGGAQKVLVNFLTCLNRELFNPKVVCLFGGKSPVASEIEGLGIPVIDFNFKNKFDVFSFWHFYNWLKHEKPAILHSSLFHANLLSRVVGRILKIPIIISWRQNINLGSNIREFLNRLSANLDDCVIAVSNEVRSKELIATRINPDKVIVVYNSINTDLYQPNDDYSREEIRFKFGIEGSTILLGTIGRLHPQKGITYLLEGFKEVRNQYKNAKLIIVGEGELKPQLIEQAKYLQIIDSTLFPGAKTNIPEILKALDVFILPSLWEGLPLALLEAMAAGLPVIATGVGGIPEVIENNRSGIIVPTADPGAIYSSIHRLISDPELRDSMGEAGRKRVVEKFDVKKNILQLERIYTQLLRAKIIEYVS